MPLFRKKSEKSSAPKLSVVPIENGSNISGLLLQAEENYNPNYVLRMESRLSLSLSSIFSNHEVLPHFIQFMDTVGAHNLIKFYLESESFAFSLKLSGKNGSIPNEAISLASNSKEGLHKTHEDATYLYNKYLKPDSPLSLNLPEEMTKAIEEQLNVTNDHTYQHLFPPVQKWVLKRLEEVYLPMYLQSSYLCKSQLNILTSETIYLSDILYNDSILFYFMEFMEQEKGRHLVDFLLMANSYYIQVQENPKANAAQALDDAMIIYDKYFSLQASSSLGFSDNLRLELELDICPEDQNPSQKCFLKPAKIVMQFLEMVYLPQFLQNQLYFKYLSELISLSQNSSLPYRKRSGSESSSSEQSFSGYTTNTLLAMDSKKLVKVKDHHYLRIDTEKFSPESLWKRELAGKLQITTIDKYGRIKSEFQPEPDRKSTASMISKAVRKLVTREDVDKNQEEMAWQVAQVIVQDICSITMGNNNS